MYFDFHTHHLQETPALLSAYPHEHTEEVLAQAAYLSVGVHPWYITAENYAMQIDWVKKQLHRPTVIAIGECGLDRVCATPWELQMRALEEMIALSEDRELPLILHIVKAHEDILQLRKKHSPRQAWIIHGFRNASTWVPRYVATGFYLSFGEKFQIDALRQTPIDRLLIETDDSKCDIAEIYTHIANLRTEANLVSHIKDNLLHLFPTLIH